MRVSDWPFGRVPQRRTRLEERSLDSLYDTILVANLGIQAGDPSNAFPTELTTRVVIILKTSLSRSLGTLARLPLQPTLWGHESTPAKGEPEKKHVTSTTTYLHLAANATHLRQLEEVCAILSCHILPELIPVWLSVKHPVQLTLPSNAEV